MGTTRQQGQHRLFKNIFYMSSYPQSFGTRQLFCCLHRPLAPVTNQRLPEQSWSHFPLRILLRRLREYASFFAELVFYTSGADTTKREEASLLRTPLRHARQIFVSAHEQYGPKHDATLSVLRPVFHFTLGWEMAQNNFLAYCNLFRTSSRKQRNTTCLGSRRVSTLRIV